MLFLAARDAGKRALDDEGGEVLAVDLGEDDEDVGEAAVGDPHLLAVQHEAAVRLSRGRRLCAERVRSGSRLAEAVRADDFAGHQLRQIFALLRIRAEERQRQDREIRLRAEGRREGRGPRHPLAHNHRRDLVELHAAVLFGDVDREKSQLAAAHQKLSRDGPVLLLQPVQLRQDLVHDELFGRTGDEALLFGQAFRRADGLGLRGGQQPLAAPQDATSIGVTHDYIRSAGGHGRRITVRRRLHSLKDSGRAHAAADAHRDHAVSDLAPLHFVQKRRRQLGARAPERVTKRDRAAVDVQPAGIDRQRPQTGEHLRRERLVELDEVDLIERQAGELQDFLHRRHRADAEPLRFDACCRKRHEPGQRRQSPLLCASART